jgi:hypothetical protein
MPAGPPHAGTPDGPEQHGLGLVVPVMGQTPAALVAILQQRRTPASRAAAISGPPGMVGGLTCTSQHGSGTPSPIAQLRGTMSAQTAEPETRPWLHVDMR